jgi:hypothetical protein
MTAIFSASFSAAKVVRLEQLVLRLEDTSVDTLAVICAGGPS